MAKVEKRRLGMAKIGLIICAILILILSVTNVWSYITLQNQIDALKDDTNGLQNQVNALNNDKSALQSQVDSLNTTYMDYIATHRMTDSEYNASIHALEDEVAELESRIEALEGKCACASFDDFNDGVADGWSTQLGNFEVVNGEYYSASDVGTKSIATVNGLNCTDYIVEVDMRFADTEVGLWARIVFRFSDYQHHYGFTISNEYDVAWLSIYTPDYPHYGFKPGGIDISVSANTDYTLRVRVQGDTVDASVDGQDVFSVLLSDYFSEVDEEYTFGEVGLRAQGAHVHFDNFTVYSLT